ncbi:MAG: substrate-binding periplasmic protein [Geminicoccaceae bacterium]
MTAWCILKLVALVPAVLAFATLLAARPASADVFTVTITEWCPYMCTGQTKRGFTTDIVDAAFRSQGHEVAFKALPWLRALDHTRRGETDASLAPAKAEAPDFIYPTVPVSHQQMCFFTRPDQEWHYESPLSLPAIRFGFLANLSLPGIMDYVGAKRGTDRVQPIADKQFMKKNFKKIDSGRIDALIDDRNVVSYYMVREDIEPDAYRVAGCLQNEPIYLGMSPTRPDKAMRMTSIYVRGLLAIKQSGELDRILASYGATAAAPNM